MFKALTIIKNNLIVSIIIAMTLGLIVGGNFDVSWMKQTILPLTFVLVYPMMVTLKLTNVLEKTNPKLQVITQIINFIIYPVITYILGVLFFKDDAFLRLGLLLIGLLPTSGMTISWTVMAKGNVNAAILMVLIGLGLGALLTPFYITFILGEAVNLPLGQFLTQIAVVIILPFFAALVTQIVLKKQFGNDRFNKNIKPKFPLFSTLGVVLIIFVAMSLRAKIIINNPMILIDMLIPLLIMYILFVTVSLVTAKLLFNRADGIALANGTLVRSLSLALAITLAAFPEAKLTSLLIAIAYTLQVQIAAWNVKLADKIYQKDDKL